MALAGLVVAYPGGAARAGSDALQAACFAPDALRALDGEKVITRGNHDFDVPPKSGAAVIPATPIEVARRGAIRRVDLPKGEKLIALTFDLCEQRGEIAGYDGAVFDYLRREDIKATLFAGGKWMRSHRARTEQLLTDPLFEIANHGENHRNLRLLDSPSIQSEITGPQLAYDSARRRLATTQCAARAPDGLDAVPQRIALFRFPFGACNASSMTAVNDAGLLAIQWDVSAGDPDPHQTPQMIANAIVRSVKPGSIVVAHGNGRGWNTAAALPLVIPKLKAMGYSFVTVSELLARGKPVIAGSCYDTRPGDTDRYDFLLAGAKAKPPLGATPIETGSLPWLTDSKAAPEAKAKPPASSGTPLPPTWPF
ncbi:MAG: polysaccharide deacetylase family protein [Hyphomicrobium sp.]|nr:polysaccharide deacetylase family protein [Hyphomicrobium sp.]